MDIQQLTPLTCCLNYATLAAGTTTTLLTTGTTAYCIRGKAYTFAAWANQATPTTDWATGAAFLPVVTNKGSVFMVGVDAAGTMRVIQGTITDLDTVSVPGAFINAPQFGGTAAQGSGTNTGNFCPVGYIVVKAAATASAAGWVFGTNNWAAVTGVTCTFINVIGWPDRPQVS